MASTPRQSLPDDFAAGAVCAVCGAAALRLAHLKSFPDYVACDNCKASFVAEDGGERVLYGNIPEAYPQARSLALRKWATLAQVAAVAQRERPSPPRPVSVPIPIGSELDRDAPLRAAASAGVPIPTQPEIARPPTRSVPLGYEEEVEEQPEQEEEDEMPAEMERDAPLGRLSRLMAGAPEPEPVADWAGSLVPDRVPTAPPPAEAIPPAPTAVAPAATAAAKPAASAPAVPAARPAAQPPDPIPGQRFRVIVRGDRVVFPMQSCAHCTHTPAPNRLTVVASLAQGQPVGRQRPPRYSVPLCRACYRRATARSAEGNNARLNAHLISALAALALLVLALGTRLLDPAKLGMGAAALFALILGVLGYALPATVLLGRTGRLPAPEDARYVRTTLLVPEDSASMEMAFEWRNARYAELFHQANQPRTLSGVVAVKDRTPAA